MSTVAAIEAKYKKKHVTDVKSGDTVKVHQKIREGNKERIQIFEGLVIRTDRKGSHTSSITVRRIASGIGVEKSYLMHSPLVVKVEVTKRSKVRRNYLTYMRERTGKSARLSNVAFDRHEVNAVPETPEPAAEPVAPEPAEAKAEVIDEPIAETPKTVVDLPVEDNVPETKTDEKSEPTKN
jgi:large subunit ribosomal protein L19